MLRREITFLIYRRVRKKVKKTMTKTYIEKIANNMIKRFDFKECSRCRKLKMDELIWHFYDTHGLPYNYIKKLYNETIK